MTRLIAGFAGSLTISVPKSGTRPTSDRVREAIFSALEARDLVDGARVVDLYAGSGALGLEAASRGATSVVLVEKAASAARVCQANARLVEQQAARFGVEPAPRIRVVTRAARSAVEMLDAPVDLVFIDPPYEASAAEVDELLAALGPHLADDAVVALERSSRSAAPAPVRGLELDRTARYGETAVHWMHRVADATS
ncbi:MAG: RsmD family RNA methyltransferase [Microcella sp.]